MLNDQTLGRAQLDQQENEQGGILGKPAFFINGRPLISAQSLEVFGVMIDPMLRGR